MTAAERVLAYFARISEAPDAIPRLRRFILDLAVRGRLVEQDPRDEPAPELLTRIRTQKVRQADLPQGWRRATIGALLDFQYGKGLKDGERRLEGPVPVFGSNGIVGFTDTPLTERSSVIVGRKGSAGALNLCIGPSWTTDVAYYVDAPPFLEIRYLLNALSALDLPRLGKGVKPGLSRSDVYEQLLCVPPLGEQHRIVAKVDQLMALCDRLEAAQKERESRRGRLVSASLARLNEPVDTPSFREHVRFHLQHLPSMTDRHEDVVQLRQTILNLAVRGKLIPQHPGEEPPDVPLGSDEQYPAGVPNGWRLVRLSSLLAEDTRNGYSRKPDEIPTGTPILRISACTRPKDGVVAEEEHKLISGIDFDVRVQYGLKVGDLLACRFNGNKSFVGRLAIFEDRLRIRPIYPDKLIRVRLANHLAAPAFIRLAGDAEMVRHQIETACATTVGNWGISAANLKNVRFPLPPIAEQRRIVAKVDQLMTVCDRLEAHLEAGRVALMALIKATLRDALIEGEQAKMITELA